MRVLFLYLRVDGTAYAHRMAGLRDALDRAGAVTAAISLRTHWFGRPILAHSLGARSLRDRVRDFDFIHAGGDAAFAAGFLKRHTRAKIIADVHGDTLREAQMLVSQTRTVQSVFNVVQARIINSVYYRTSDYFLAVSEPSIERLQSEHHISRDRIGLVRNGVDLELFKPARDPTVRSDASPFRVAYAGRFDAWQGIGNLVDAFAEIDATTARLTVIGFTEIDAPIRATMATRLGAKVELVDMLARPKLIEKLHDADALVIPRTRHPAVEVALPTKFAEYLALGKPLIVCDVDETARLVRANGCGFVSAPDPRSLAQTVRQAAATPRAALVEMGENARKLAESEFGWERIGSRYLGTLERWLGQ